MSRTFLTLLFPVVLCIGCTAEETTTTVPPANPPDPSSMPDPRDLLGESPAGVEDQTEGPMTASSASVDTTPAADEPAAPAESPADGAGIALNPENTMITFVGIHTGEKPDPRTGRFEEFTGTAAMADGKLASLSVEIDTTSVATDIEKLTNHLKTPDFFNVREHPKATFTSTEIATADDGSVTITGDLTLLGTTKSISFPATVATDGGLTLSAEFTIDRSEFGMNYGLDNVDKNVSMKVTVAG